MLNVHEILTRHPKNPVLDPDDYPGTRTLFNPSPVAYNGKTILLVSRNLFSGGPGGRTFVAESEDGVAFKLRDEPLISRETLPPPFNQCRHFIDNRISKIEDTYYILTPVGSSYGSASVILGKTTDWESYEPISIICPPNNRGASMFQGKIGGKYYKLDRPGAGTGSYGTIWISSSPDMLHWGNFRPLLYPGFTRWSNVKIGPTPPIPTPDGWLEIIHGVSHPGDGYHYYVGAMLLDREDPTRIVGLMHTPLLKPEASYEVRGNCGNVVFPCGAIGDVEKDEFRLYYGGADTYICLATGKLSDIVEACRKEL